MDHIREADFYVIRNGAAVCTLCPNRCCISDGDTGRCGTRTFRDGRLYADGHSKVASIAIDPIEKKPLYHYHPGSSILSVGTYGCNMVCAHCQNHRISQEPVRDLLYIQPSELISMCKDKGLDSIAFTYNEPSVWFEYIRDTMECADGIRFVLVTNGYIEPGPLDILCEHTDAMNIDVKAFTEGFYREVCGARLSSVLRTCESVHTKGVHLELTYLVIPSKNDSPEEIKGFSEWVRDSLSSDVPVHFTRFFPDNRMTYIGPTPITALREAERIAKETGLRNVYLGNVRETSVTCCTGCGRPLITRMCSYVDSAVHGDRCPYCGTVLYMRQ